AVQQVACPRHRTAEEEGARREQHGDDVASRKSADSLVPGRLQMVDGARRELDRERDGAGLRELVAVEPEREAGVAAGGQVPARLLGVERVPLEEDVGGLRELRRLGEHLRKREVE